MAKKQVTLPMVRQALIDVLDGYKGQKVVRTMNDEQLLKLDIVGVYGLDSLDLTEMMDVIYHRYDIDIAAQALEKSEFWRETTVERFLEMCNNYRV